MFVATNKHPFPGGGHRLARWYSRSLLPISPEAKSKRPPGFPGGFPVFSSNKTKNPNEEGHRLARWSFTFVATNKPGSQIEEATGSSGGASRLPLMQDAKTASLLRHKWRSATNAKKPKEFF